MVKRIGRFEFDPSSGSLTTTEGDCLELSAQSTKVLALLADANGETLSKNTLLQSVWPDVIVSEDSLYQCVSEIRRLLGPEARDLLKTVPRHGYRLVPPVLGPERATTLPRLRGFHWVGVALGVFLVAIALWWSGQTPVTTDERPHSIAVLPFKPTENDTGWARIGRGLGTDIANELARNDWLYVTAPFSAGQIKGTPLDAAHDLGVRYVLDGTIQRSGATVRISANLTDALSGKILWSDRWSGKGNDLFALQDKIIGRIGSSLASGYSGVILAHQTQQARTRPTDSFTAYDHYLVAVDLKHTFLPENFPTATEHIERAIALDPDYAKAWVVLSWLQDFSADLLPSAEAAAKRKESQLSARRAFAIDPKDPDVLVKIGMSRAEMGDFDAAQWALRRAVETAPNNADVLAIAGWIVEAGIEGIEPLSWVQHAIDLNPMYPSWYNIALGASAFMAGDYGLAVEALSAAPSDYLETNLYMASAEALQSNLPEAHAAAIRLKTLAPNFILEEYLFGTTEELPHFALLFEGARIAGIPITPEDSKSMPMPSVLPVEQLSEDER